MHEILRTNDPVVLSFAQSVLSDAGIEALVADAHISGLEGAIGAFPRRLMVTNDDAASAMAALQDAGLSTWLIAP